MHVDFLTPTSDLPDAVWSNSSTNVQFTTLQDTGTAIATSSSEEYELSVTSPNSLTFSVCGNVARKPLCMIGIPSDGTVNTISLTNIATLPPGPGPIPVRSRKLTRKRDKARPQLLKWLQRRTKRNKEWVLEQKVEKKMQF